ncbi:diadenylate cyclase CdaA [Chloroflexota bacterium]
MEELISNLIFIFQRLDWLGVIDILLVTVIFFGVLYLLRDTQAMVLLRGVLVLFVLIAMLTSLANLPAFSYLITTALPALLFSIPVILAPEIRRALERIGRAGTLLSPMSQDSSKTMDVTIKAIVDAVARLSARQHGALIILQRMDNLDEYIKTGVEMNALVTPELLLQVFYPNTPLHDGAVIVDKNQLVAASCVMPLSASGILGKSPERQMGLRHRASLGISEATDAISVVVSEETGNISIAHSGRMIRRLGTERLQNILVAFFSATSSTHEKNVFKRMFPYLFPGKEE